MKNKNNLKEGALDVGITSYPTTSVNKSTTNSNTNGVNVNVKKKDLSDPTMQKNISNIKNANVNVVDENSSPKPMNLEYLSEIEGEDGQISKPFTINGKNYQMVRAITPDRKKISGVYSLDETDESGKNKIYSIEEFEIIAKNSIKEEGVVEPEAPEVMTLNPDKFEEEETGPSPLGPSFEGFRHFIVNRKSGKARKFKGIEDLAKAKMMEDEQYMGMRDFKKYIDEVLFGAGKKRSIKEEEPQTEEVTTPPVPENQGVVHMFKLIDTAIPKNAYENIKANPVAQAQAIAEFVNRVGVPPTKLNEIIANLRALAAKKPSQTTQVATAPPAAPAPIATVNETKVITKFKVKDLK